MDTFDGLDETDAAPFDELEALAMSLCREAGSDWNAKGTKRNHWRGKAARVALAPPDDGHAFTDCAGLLAFGFVIGGIAGGLIVAAVVALT